MFGIKLLYATKKFVGFTRKGLMTMFFMQVAALLAVYLSAMVLLIYMKKDISIANFAWGGGVLLLTLYTFFSSGTYDQREVLVTSLITLWAVRMIVHLYCRYTGKDPRFTTWKTEGGSKALAVHIFYIFGPQLLLLLIMSVPSIIVNSGVQPNLELLDFIGLGLWLVGFCCEALGDYQLYMFTKNPSNSNKIMRYGLWRYTRHPNYFGEVVMWWGMFLIAYSAPGGIFALISPVTITILLLFV